MKYLISNFFKYVSKHERLLSLFMTFIQTLVVCAGVYFALQELSGNDKNDHIKKRAESWDIYKSHTKNHEKIELFFHDFNEEEKNKENNITSEFFSQNRINVMHMYTEFELCISSERCDEETLILLACSSALQLTEYDYNNNGSLLLVGASNNEKFKKSSLDLNLYRFSSRCIPIAEDYRDLSWKKDLDELGGL